MKHEDWDKGHALECKWEPGAVLKMPVPKHGDYCYRIMFAIDVRGEKRDRRMVFIPLQQCVSYAPEVTKEAR